MLSNYTAAKRKLKPTPNVTAFSQFKNLAEANHSDASRIVERSNPGQCLNLTTPVPLPPHVMNVIKESTPTKLNFTTVESTINNSEIENTASTTTEKAEYSRKETTTKKAAADNNSITGTTTKSKQLQVKRVKDWRIRNRHIRMQALVRAELNPGNKLCELEEEDNKPTEFQVKRVKDWRIRNRHIRMQALVRADQNPGNKLCELEEEDRNPTELNIRNVHLSSKLLDLGKTVVDGTGLHSRVPESNAEVVNEIGNAADIASPGKNLDTNKKSVLDNDEGTGNSAHTTDTLNDADGEGVPGSNDAIVGDATENLEITNENSVERIVTNVNPLVTTEEGSPLKDAVKPKWKRILGNTFRKSPGKGNRSQLEGSQQVCTTVAVEAINDKVQSNGHMKSTTAQKWSKFGNALRGPFLKKAVIKDSKDLTELGNTQVTSTLQVNKKFRNLFRRKVKAPKPAPHDDASSDADVDCESSQEEVHELESVNGAQMANENETENELVVEQPLVRLNGSEEYATDTAAVDEPDLSSYFEEHEPEDRRPSGFNGLCDLKRTFFYYWEPEMQELFEKHLKEEYMSKSREKKKCSKMSFFKSKASSVTELETTADNSVIENASSSGAQAERRAADLAPLNSDAGPYAVNENSPMHAIDYGYEEIPTVTSIDSEPSIDEPIVATEDNNEVGEDVPRATSWESIRLSRLSDQAAGIAGCHRMETKTQRFKQKIQALGKLFAYAFHFKSRSSIVENADDNDRDVGRGTVSPEQNENAALEQPCIKKKKKVSRIVNWKQKIQHRLKKLTKIGAAAGYEIDTSVDWETYIATFRADRATYIAALRDFCQRQ